MKYKKRGSRALWLSNTPKEKKPTWTGEYPLFIKIAEQRSYNGVVSAKHIDIYWNICSKMIRLEDLTVTNFSHKIPKSRWEEYRLDPWNIEIVSMAFHHWEHTKQILKVEFPN
jgi:hypothetical protein